MTTNSIKLLGTSVTIEGVVVAAHLQLINNYDFEIEVNAQAADGSMDYRIDEMDVIPIMSRPIDQFQYGALFSLGN